MGLRGYASQSPPKDSTGLRGYASQPRPKESTGLRGYASRPRPRGSTGLRGYASQPRPTESTGLRGYASQPRPRGSTGLRGYASQSHSSEGRDGVTGRAGYTCTQTSRPGNPPPSKPQNPEASAASDRRLQSKKKNLGRERGPGFPGEGKETHGTLELRGRGQRRALLAPDLAASESLACQP